MKLIDLTGGKFGRLTVIQRNQINNANKRPRWDVVCDCGNTLTVSGADLRSGHTKSCGCLRREHAASQALMAAQASSKAQKGVWKVDTVDYHSAHSRVRCAKGAAKTHKCIDCGSEATDWSYNYQDPNEGSGKNYYGNNVVWSGNPDYYEPRCSPCHYRFDRGRLG